MKMDGPHVLGGDHYGWAKEPLNPFMAILQF
jgi:hypothetical protein